MNVVDWNRSRRRTHMALYCLAVQLYVWYQIQCLGVISKRLATVSLLKSRRFGALNGHGIAVFWAGRKVVLWPRSVSETCVFELPQTGIRATKKQYIISTEKDVFFFRFAFVRRRSQQRCDNIYQCYSKRYDQWCPWMRFLPYSGIHTEDDTNNDSNKALLFEV